MLFRSLWIYGNDEKNNWAQLLPLAQYVHNSWPNSTTGQTPYDLLMGHTPSIHKGTSALKNVPEIEKRAEWLALKRRNAQVAIRSAQRVLMKQSDRRKGQWHYRPFQKGDKVWLEGTNIKLSHPVAKLAPKRYGPFTIIDDIGPVTFKLKLPEHWKIHPVFHASLLTPYKETEEHGQNFPSPPPDLIDGEEEYEVERVINSRRFGRHKKLQYLLRWKGYSEAHDSWEDADQVYAPELIKEYYDRGQQL